MGGGGALAPLILSLFPWVSDHPQAPVALLTQKRPPVPVKLVVGVCVCVWGQGQAGRFEERKYLLLSSVK